MISVCKWWTWVTLITLAACVLNDGLNGIKFAIVFCGMLYGLIQGIKDLP